jgi:hypothetical protein
MELLLTEALRSGSSTMLEECQAWGRKHCASTQCSPETASHLEAAAAAATSLAAAASAAAKETVTRAASSQSLLCLEERSDGSAPADLPLIPTVGLHGHQDELPGGVSKRRTHIPVNPQLAQSKEKGASSSTSSPALPQASPQTVGEGAEDEFKAWAAGFMSRWGWGR